MVDALRARQLVSEISHGRAIKAQQLMSVQIVDPVASVNPSPGSFVASAWVDRSYRIYYLGFHEFSARYVYSISYVYLIDQSSCCPVFKCGSP